jgi:hypothetical protein
MGHMVISCMMEGLTRTVVEPVRTEVESIHTEVLPIHIVIVPVHIREELTEHKGHMELTTNHKKEQEHSHRFYHLYYSLLENLEAMAIQITLAAWLVDILISSLLVHHLYHIYHL